MTKIAWASGIAALIIMVVLTKGVDASDRALALLLAAYGAGVGWARFWRPHLAATPEGLIVRQARGAVLVSWSNISGVSRPTMSGITIWVWVGSHVGSAVPAKGPVEMLLRLESEADRAAEFIKERARLAQTSAQR